MKEDDNFDADAARAHEQDDENEGRKMKEEFNLSEKITNKFILLCAWRLDMGKTAEQFVELTDEIEEDVQKAVAELKENIKKDSWATNDYLSLSVLSVKEIFEKIEKSFGEKLI